MDRLTCIECAYYVCRERSAAPALPDAMLAEKVEAVPEVRAAVLAAKGKNGAVRLLSA
jgi:hypothetical protein